MEIAKEEMKDVGWYHGDMSRHVAESILLQNGCDGTYLMRDSGTDGLALSVRCKDSVKHYSITLSGDKFHFGMGEFQNMKAFVEHVEMGRPLIAGDSGVLSMLKEPYPRVVPEPAIYELVRVHAEVGPGDLSKRQSADKHSDTSERLSVGSKEGYLTKLGGNVKNWKTRWFVLKKNELSYYKNRSDPKPIRTLDLNECKECAREYRQAKGFCFRLVFPSRTFYICSTSDEEAESWVELIQWKLKLHRSNEGDGH